MGTEIFAAYAVSCLLSMFTFLTCMASHEGNSVLVYLKSLQQVAKSIKLCLCWISNLALQGPYLANLSLILESLIILRSRIFNISVTYTLSG